MASGRCREQPHDGSPSSRTAVVVLVGTEPLSARQRLALAAMIVVIGELDHATLNPMISAAFTVVDDAFLFA